MDKDCCLLSVDCCLKKNKMKKFYKLLLLCILILSGGNALKAHVHESAHISGSKLYGEYDSYLEIDQTEMIIAVGHYATLNASVGSYPPTHEPGNITFSSSNSSIATVDNNGDIYAIAAGEVTITVKLALKYTYINNGMVEYDYAEQKCHVKVCGHDHSYHDTATDNGDGTHSFTCTECNAEASEAHTGDATCATEAACTLCGAYYINPNNHEYESNNGFCCGTIQAPQLVGGYYEIYNAGNLFWFAEYVNTIDRTASAKLMNDIDLENRAWTPIGSTGEGNNNFRGHFDGNGKTITGLYVNALRAGLGFFGEVRGGTVEDFTIYGEVELNGKYDYVGGVIGSAPGFNSNQPDHNGATIRNITSYVNVTLGEGSHGSNRVAGFIGYANHETLIENCTWYGTLDLGPYRAQDGVGGLVGKANDNSAVTIRNCAAYGTIKTSYKSGSYNNHNTIYIGGIVSNSVSSAQTSLESCVWAGTLINNTDLGSNAHISAIGTLNGSKSVTNCYALNNMPYVTTHNAHNTGITTATAEQLASGEIAYKLQGTQTTHVWGQNIDNGETKDTKPILGSAKVYKHTISNITLYSNQETLTASGKCGDNLYWYVNNENVLIIFGTGNMYDYDISSNKAPWRNLTPKPISLVLEEEITHIGNYAFPYCSGLTGSLTIPNSVTSIGNYAFYYCSGFNGSLTIGNSVTTIGGRAFLNCSGFKGDLTIPNSVTTIGDSAFDGCEGFTGSLTIPNSVTAIGEYAFGGCEGFTGSLTIPNSVTTIGNDAFNGCSGFTGDLTIPNSVTAIGEYAFYYCSGFNGSLTIPNSVTYIGEYAFYGCTSLNEVYSFAETAPTLGTKAFKYINGNTILYHPTSSEQSYEDKGWFEYFSKRKAFNGQCGDNLYWYVDKENALTIFGTGAMYDYGDSSNKAPWRDLNPAPTSLVLEEGITHIGNFAFYYCPSFNCSLTIPNSVTTIGNYAFAYCSGFTGSLTIPNNVTYIGNSAFSSCSGFTGSLTIPNSVTYIGNYTFSSCSGFTGSLTIPNSVTSIGNYTFRNCSGFTGTLTIPNSVTTIGDHAFFNCKGFTGDLTIPNSVTTIGNYAFYECEGLSEIFLYRDTNPTIGSNAFLYLNSSAKIYVPVIWSSFTGIPSSNLVKMATYVGQQSTDNGQQSSSTAWVGLTEGQTEPGKNDHVAINAPLVLGRQQDNKTTRQQGSEANSLWVKSFGYCGNGTTVNGSITIEEGGELYCEVAKGEVTVKKEIIGYAGQQSTDNSQQTVWYTIASPLKDTLQISDPQFLNSSIPQFLSSNSDLYRYDEPTYTWQNAKPGEGSTNFQTIDPGRGYLYANAENTTLKFTGMINTDEVTYNLTTDGDILTGFHLVGNPFTHDITFAHLNATKGAELVNGYYVLNGEGAWGATLGSNEDDVIKVGQGALIKATNAGTLAIRRDVTPVASRGQQTTDNRQQILDITVSNAKHSDRAFVVFDKGVGLDKINHENENIPLLYIPMDDADYAIAMMDINVNEIPVSFETNVMGQYTISLRQDNCEFDELYLLDKQTGEKVNILENDYTFIATSNDAPERFVLLKDNGQQTTDNSHFAYINNGDIVVFDIEGNADINIFDAMGRCLYKGNSSDETARIANDFSAGVYVIQKADDNGVKVQKLMID